MNKVESTRQENIAGLTRNPSLDNDAKQLGIAGQAAMTEEVGDSSLVQNDREM